VIVRTLYSLLFLQFLYRCKEKKYKKRIRIKFPFLFFFVYKDFYVRHLRS